MRSWRSRGALALSGLLFLCSGLTVCAEETMPAGYHVYDVQEAEASDSWYAAGRSVHLLAGLSKIVQYDVGYAICDGYTLAQHDSDRVYLRIYLDQSDNGEDGWHTLDYWTDIVENGSVATTESDPYKVDRDKYYSVSGVHSVTQDGYTETTTTCTNALYFD